MVASSRPLQMTSVVWSGARRLFVLALWVAIVGSGGCAWDEWHFNDVHLIPLPTPPPGPADSLVVRGDGLEPQRGPTDAKVAAELAGAHEFYRHGEYGKAESLFHDIAENKHNSPQVAEEARYYEAECLRRQDKYPKAGDVYHQLLTDFPSGMHRDQAVEREFEIANLWIDDTREEMQLYREKQNGQRSWIMPASFVHLETTKPLLDEEGRALELLERVVLGDINGKRADEALYLAGSIKFYREDYKEADRYFSQLVEMHPNSRFAAQAVELAIISKHMSTGGSDYDGRKVAEARKLVDTALRNYPALAAQKNAFLERQLAGINLQQAEKDFKIAEFYRRTGHPGSAYFYYEIVRRRYPGTRFFDDATIRMQELREKPGKKDQVPPAVPPADQPLAGPAQPEAPPAKGPGPLEAEGPVKGPGPLEAVPAPDLVAPGPPSKR
jgi:outer membrane protein assembly factor BamD (BamD/ComL family)